MDAHLPSEIGQSGFAHPSSSGFRKDFVQHMLVSEIWVLSEQKPDRCVKQFGRLPSNIRQGGNP